MKKIIFSIVAMAAVSLGFVACGSDDDGPVITHDKTAAESAGTYVGEWAVYSSQEKRQADADSLGIFDKYVTKATSKSPGSVSFTATEDKYVANVTIATESQVTPYIEINKTCSVNISWANDIIRFANPSSANDLGCAITSEIADGKLVLHVLKSVKSGRNSTVYYYRFVGEKQ